MSILNILNPRTKANRLEFWVIALVSVVLSIILLTYFTSSEQALKARPDAAVALAMLPSILIGLLVGILNLYVIIVVHLRRLNDLGHSKLWFLLGLVPFVGLILFLYLGFASGKQDTQRVAAA